MRRFEIADLSMSPALVPGDYVIARRNAGAEPGAIIVFEQRPGFWMVKRVVDSEPAGRAVGPGQVWVLADNLSATRSDSRTLGPIDESGTYRVVWRYWPLHRVGRISPAPLPSG